MPLESTDPSPDPAGELALVMTGGGARAAYQVGLLRYLARRFPNLEVPLITGVSAGAINAAYLGTHTCGFAECVGRLSEIWSTLETQSVLRVGTFELLSKLFGWGFGLLSAGHHVEGQVSMVDTSPLRELLIRVLDAPTGELQGIEENLASGRLRAVALTTLSYTTGQTITWVQGREIGNWERPGRRGKSAHLTVEHVMASAALPFLFPAVRLDRAWHGDGGIRLTWPLAPAIHLGAARILAISTRYGRTVEEAGSPVLDGYPPPAQIGGQLLNSIFLDQLDADALILERINRFIRSGCAEQAGELRPVELMVLRPSRDLGQLANEYEARLPRAFRFLFRGLGTKQTRSNDVLSLVMFQPDYLTRLLELGEADAEAHGDALAEFVAPTRSAPVHPAGAGRPG